MVNVAKNSPPPASKQKVSGYSGQSGTLKWQGISDAFLFVFCSFQVFGFAGLPVSLTVWVCDVTWWAEPADHGHCRQMHYGYSIPDWLGSMKVVFTSNWEWKSMEYPAVRDWSLITGRGGYKMGKSRVRNLSCPPPLKTG